MSQLAPEVLPFRVTIDGASERGLSRLAFLWFCSRSLWCQPQLTAVRVHQWMTACYRWPICSGSWSSSCHWRTSGPDNTAAKSQSRWRMSVAQGKSSEAYPLPAVTNQTHCLSPTFIRWRLCHRKAQIHQIMTTGSPHQSSWRWRHCGQLGKMPWQSQRKQCALTGLDKCNVPVMQHTHQCVCTKNRNERYIKQNRLLKQTEYSMKVPCAY